MSWLWAAYGRCAAGRHAPQPARGERWDRHGTCSRGAAGESVWFAAKLWKDETEMIAETMDVDWAAFLADCDLDWAAGVGTRWGESAFIADGQTGASIYGMADDPDVLRWELGRTDVAAHFRLPPDWCDPRLPIGNVVLRACGPVTGSSMRLRLWDAEATGEIRTATGVLRWRSLVERETGVLVVQLDERDVGETAEIGFEPEWSVSAMAVSRGVDFEALPEGQRPPRPYREDAGDVAVVVQPLTVHGAHASAWCVESAGPGCRVLYLAVRPRYRPEGSREQDCRDARADAVSAVRAARAEGVETLLARHRRWWHDYLSQAWVSLPQDPTWEKFYWIQIYKFGCASRADVPIITDNLGPWYTACQWAGTWWNLNVQLSYYPAFSANRLDVGRSLVTAMDHYFETGSMRVPGNPEAITMDRTSSYDGCGGETYEIGNLTWCLHNYWRFWKYSQDEAVGRQLARLLKADVNYYLDVLIERDGRLHVPTSASPEYPGGPWEDTGYSLQLLRWALGTLLDFDTRFGLQDPLVPRWRDTLQRLADVPVGPQGLMVAAGQAFEVSHRHYSHLLAFYPLHTLTPEDGPETEALLRRSLEHWCSMKEAWCAYSASGATAMYAVLGEGDRAREQLDWFLAQPNIQPNTMYIEPGGAVIETPLSSVESVNYMLLQSWGGVIRVFPAMPSRWEDARFVDLRAEGAFLVTAEWCKGQTVWVRVRSLAGEPCCIETEQAAFRVDGARDFQVGKAAGPRGRIRFTIDLQAGQTVDLVRLEEYTRKDEHA